MCKYNPEPLQWPKFPGVTPDQQIYLEILLGNEYLRYLKARQARDQQIYDESNRLAYMIKNSDGTGHVREILEKQLIEKIGELNNA